MIRLDELATQALGYLALGDFARALEVYAAIVKQQPGDLASRMRIADALVQIGQRELAQRAYAAVAFYDLQGGRPLHALVAIQALADLGQDVAQLKLALAQLYGAGSPKIARVGGRLAPPLGDTPIAPPDLSRAVGIEEAALAAAAIAADTTTITDFPSQFPPVPLLSDLSEQAFARVLDVAVVQRLGHGALLIRAGDPGDAFFLLASGEVRVYTPEQVELARLHEGAIFGEMALINAQPRSASVEVVGSADVISLGRKALEAAAGELEAVASALDKFTRDRLLKNLLATSPLFKPFTQQQRIDLVRRFTGHEIAEGDEIIRQGDAGQGLYVLLSGGVEVVQGGEPFETQLAELKPGDCFGEISLVLEQPAMATVRATRRSTVLFLAREYFQRLTEALPEIRTYFEDLAAERLKAASLARLEPEDLLEEDGDSRVLF